MPDFNIHAYAFCLNSRNYHREVIGSKGDKYIVSFCYQHEGDVQYDWQCNCKGYKFRGFCRHINEVRAIPVNEGGHCGWHEFMDDEVPFEDELGEHNCPRCGGPIDYENWAI